MHYIEPDQEQQKLDITGYVQPDQQEYALGDPISVTLYITNRRDQTRYVFIPRGRADGIQMKVVEGPKIEQKDMAHEPEPGMVAETKIAPGETVSQRFVLSEWLHFSKAAAYTIDCSIPVEAANKSLRESSADRVSERITIRSRVQINLMANR